MKVEFELETLGWMIFSFLSNEKEPLRIAHSSDYGDGVYQFIDKLIQVNEAVLKDTSFKREFTMVMELCNDFSTYKMRFTKKYEVDDLLLSIEEYRTEDGARISELLNCQLDILETLESILVSLDNLLSKFGLVGYQLN